MAIPQGADQPMKILVTGGAGFIGSYYVRMLLDDGYPGFGHAQVTVLDKMTYAGNLANLEPVAASPRFSFVRGDICDAALLASVLPGHDVVINFAAEPHANRATAAKAGADLIAQAYARAHGLDVSVTRCCNTYGPYQYPEKIIPLFVTNLLDGLKVSLYGDGQNVRGWVHVDDHCRGIQLVLEKGQPGRVYHITGDVEISDMELTQALLQHCGAGRDMVALVADREGHDPRYSLDDSLLRGMGYSPQIPFSEGLKATVRWYQGNRRWWEPLKQLRPGPVHGTALETHADVAPRFADPVRRRPTPRLRKIIR
jgi:dTDP-glucose 4,6-dehydratase